jgi:hypothetical protein
VALLTGYRALLLVVGGLYLLAYLFAGRWLMLADRALVRREAEPSIDIETGPEPSIAGS